jgi:predicted ATPase
LTSFIERNEVNELQALLAEHRLLTITGSGGVGKTRIAIEVARRTEHLYDETWFVDLLPVRDGRLIVSQIAARFNVPLEGADGLTGIVHHLRSRRVLLVMDNCEHVVADAASVIGNLLQRCRSLTVLATSREPLALSGELAYRLPCMNPQAARDLFVARAQASDPTLSFDAQRLAAVTEICMELDGIPLAIELAASRVSTLGFEPLRTRLHGGISLTGSRDLPLRHQTMIATIGWSYDLLSGAEQLLLRRLSVFAGGFTLESAEDVCCDESLPAAAIANEVSTLAQKSLINIEHAGTSTRYRFLDSIRTFAWERLLESGQLEKVMLRLIEWLTQEAAPLESTTPGELFAELRCELDNVAAAVGTSRQMEMRTLGFGLLERLRESENPELIGLLISAMAAFLTDTELLALSERAIPLLIAAGHGARAADLHARCASLECVRGDAAAAENHLVRGEALLTTGERCRSRAGFSFASYGAYVYCLLKNFEGARALLDGLEIPPGDPYEVEVRLVLAEVEFCEGHIEKAIEILTSAKPGLARYPNAKELTIVVSGGLAGYQLALGSVRAAEEELREALSAADRECDFWFTTGIEDLGRYAAYFAATSGRAELAARLLGACDRRSNPASLEDDSKSRDLAAKAIEGQLSPERAEALRCNGAGEDLYELLEEFLAQPAAAESARPSATSSPRATSVIRSSPN